MYLGVGEVIADKYRIIRLLGEGGMGAVYEGENVRIRHRVAIKVLHAAVANNREVVDRFEREAQVAGQAGSEHIVEVLDMGELPNGQRYTVMEFLDGESLAARVDSGGAMTVSELVPCMLQLLDGLAAAHDAGIVHRDLKPENVYLLRSRGGTRDFVKILDFGISKFNLAADNRVNVTRTGSVMGTPCYMSPEHARGARDVDSRTDLYAAGVMLYECLAACRPFDGDNPNEVLFKVVLDDPPKLSELVPELDPRFITIVEKAMARERDKRFQTAREFQDALLDYARAVGISVLPRPVSLTDTRVSLINIPSELSALRASRPVISTPAPRPSLPSPGEPSNASPSQTTQAGRPSGRVSVGSWNPVVMASRGRVPRSLVMIGVGVGIFGSLVGALAFGMSGSNESKLAAAALQKVTTWDPPALVAKSAKVTVTPAEPGSVVNQDAPKKKKKSIIWHPKAHRPAAPAPGADKSPPSAGGRKIYTEL
jgi:eukaryotic-like serine/threonine-protein kinase